MNARGSCASIARYGGSGSSETPVWWAASRSSSCFASAWLDAEDGRGGFVLVEGEAGVGKSRLVDEFLLRLEQGGEDVIALVGATRLADLRAAQQPSPKSLLAHLGESSLEQKLSQLLPSTPRLVPAFAALLTGAQPADGAEPLTPESTHTVFRHLTRALARDHPLVWIVEDLHFAQDDDRALLLSLARIAYGQRILIVATTRPGLSTEEVSSFIGVDGAQHLALGRLSAREVVQLVRAAVGSERLGDELGGKVAYKSDGNAFFVVEMLQELRRGGLLERLARGSTSVDQSLAALEVPSSVRGLVQTRLEHLGREERAIWLTGAKTSTKRVSCTSGR